MLSEILSKIGFDYRLAIANAVNFSLIFFLLKRYLFGPLSQSIEKKKMENEQAKFFFKDAEEKINAVNKEKEEILVVAHKKALDIIEDAQKKKKSIVENAKSEALLEKQKILEAGQDEINNKEREIMSKINNEISDMIIKGAEKIINNDFSNEVKANISKSMIK